MSRDVTRRCSALPRLYCASSFARPAARSSGAVSPCSPVSPPHSKTLTRAGEAAAHAAIVAAAVEVTGSAAGGAASASLGRRSGLGGVLWQWLGLAEEAREEREEAREERDGVDCGERSIGIDGGMAVGMSVDMAVGGVASLPPLQPLTMQAEEGVADAERGLARRGRRKGGGPSGGSV